MRPVVHLGIHTALLSQLSARSKAPDAKPNLAYVEAERTYVSEPDAGWIIARPLDADARVKRGDLLFEPGRQNQLASLAEAESWIDQSAAHLDAMLERLDQEPKP